MKKFSFRRIAIRTRRMVALVDFLNSLSLGVVLVPRVVLNDGWCILQAVAQSWFYHLCRNSCVSMLGKCCIGMLLKLTGWMPIIGKLLCPPYLGNTCWDKLFSSSSHWTFVTVCLSCTFIALLLASATGPSPDACVEPMCLMCKVGTVHFVLE